MAVLTRTITVNAAFLQEIKEDNRELRRLIQYASDLLATSTTGPNAMRDAANMLAELRDQFAMHFSLEEAYGYFDDAIDVEPRLSEKAESLRLEHETLFLEICEVVEQAERLLYHEPSAQTLKRIEARFMAFRHRFQSHETREEDLIMQSLDDDIGVGD